MPPPSGSPVSKSKNSVPPCPKCQLTKSEYERTLANYQKAYRKKVDSVKIELLTTRNQVKSLKGQVLSLKRWSRMHLPSLAAGILLSLLVKKLAGKFMQKKKPAGDDDDGEGEEDEEEEEEAGSSSS
eukprot:gene22902-30078_t